MERGPRPEAQWPPNPYDFSAPAGDRTFAGRRSEKERLEKFIASISSDHQRSLLIHGRRGIGKTSLVGQIAEIAAKHRIFVGHIDLDAEGAAETPFLIEAVIALAHAANTAGAFGDQYGRALELALLGSDVDLDAGPLRVAAFDGRRQRADRLPDLLVRTDLDELADGVRSVGGNGLLLVIDEGDHLLAHPSTAQRLRNVFITHGNISLVVVGTDDLLAAADAQLAPLGRHFLRLEVPPLSSVIEVWRCLVKPLSSAGLDDRLRVSWPLAAEVHSLTAGRPFEVAMLGHLMYAEVVERSGSELELSPSVIEATAALLRPTVEQATLAHIASLAPADVGRAARYCVEPDVTLRELAYLRLALEPLTVESVEITRAAVLADWRVLVEQGLALVEGEFLRPTLGEWSRLYLKYRAESLGVLPEGNEGKYAARLAGRVATAMLDTLDDESSATTALRSGLALVDGSDPGVVRDLDLLRRGDLEAFVTDGDIFGDLVQRFKPPAAVPAAIALMTIPFEVEEFGFSLNVFLDLDMGTASPEEIAASCMEVLDRAAPYHVRAGRIDILEVAQSTWRRAGVLAGARIGAAMVTSLWESGSIDGAAQFGGEELGRLLPALDGLDQLFEGELDFLNNVGFVRLLTGDFEGAYDLFSRAAVRGGVSSLRPATDRVVLQVNMAVVCAALGRADESRTWCADVLSLDEPGGDPLVLAAYLPRRAGQGAPRVVPVNEPRPRAIAEGCLLALRAETGDAAALTEAEALRKDDGGAWCAELVDAIRAVVTNPTTETPQT